MRAFFPRRSPLAALALILTSGCYKLVPVSPESTAPQSQLVLDFADTGAVQLGGLLGNAVTSARGRSAIWSPDSVRLSMIATTTRFGGEQFWHGERIAIPRSSVARVHERRLDRGRTALLAFVGLVLAVTTQQLIEGDTEGNPRPPVLPPID